ncbi:MAG: hypothetical protein AAFR96_06740 [Planctomycetota bacterium]
MFPKLAILSAALFTTSAASAQIVTLTPDLINLGDTNTASFSDGDLTLTPFIGANPATFNDNASRLGIDGQGTNDQAFNDPDTDPNNGNEEMLQFAFSANSGLTQVAWDFSRADNVSISGFLADPGASFSGQFSDPNGVEPDLSAIYDAQTGTLSFSLPFNIAFGGNQGFLDLSNPAASAGATLMLSVTDTVEAGAQLAIRSLSYNNAVPAPSTAAAAVLLAGTLARRRRGS